MIHEIRKTFYTQYLKLKTLYSGLNVGHLF